MFWKKGKYISTLSSMANADEFELDVNEVMVSDVGENIYVKKRKKVK